MLAPERWCKSSARPLRVLSIYAREERLNEPLLAQVVVGRYNYVVYSSNETVVGTLSFVTADQSINQSKARNEQ